MKKRLLCGIVTMALLCGCSPAASVDSEKDMLSSPAASAQTSQAESSSPPIPASAPESEKALPEYELLNAWDLLDTAPLQIDGSWSYFCASIQTSQGKQTILARENPKGDSEVLITLPIAGAYITYVENSLQQSGNQCLYFTAPTEAVGQNELYSFRLSDAQVTKLLPAPCSNMVVPADPPRALAGFGWLVYEDKAVGVDLAAGQPYQGGSLKNDLDGHFFYGVGAGFDTKYTVLEAVKNDVLTLKTIQYDSETSAPEQVTQLYYSVSSEQYSAQPSSNFVPATPSASNPSPVTPPPSVSGDGSCAAAGCGSPAKYGSFCADHVCMANGCFNERYPGDRYCATHSDLVADAPEYACTWPGGCAVRAKYGAYCSEHACKVNNCVNPRLPEGKYCEGHSQSQLCKVSGCYQSALVGGGYCAEHQP